MNFYILTPDEILRLLKVLWRLLLAILIAQVIGMVTGLTLGSYSLWFFNLWFGIAYSTPVGYLSGLLWLKSSKPGCISNEKIPVLILGAISFSLPISGYFFSFFIPEFEKMMLLIK